MNRGHGKMCTYSTSPLIPRDEVAVFWGIPAPQHRITLWPVFNSGKNPVSSPHFSTE